MERLKVNFKYLHKRVERIDVYQLAMATYTDALNFANYFIRLISPCH